MPIEFEAIRNKLEADRSARLSETVDFFSELVKENERGEIENLNGRIELGQSILQQVITLGSLIEFLNEEEKSIREYLEEKGDAIIARLEHAGVDLTGIVEPMREPEEPQAQPEFSAEDEAEKKRKGIERIRRHMGNLEAFKTGDPEFDERLWKPINTIKGVRFDMWEGFKNKFGPSGGPRVADFLSQNPEEIEKADFWGRVRVSKVIEQIYALGLVPDEKWDYAEMVDEFMEKQPFQVDEEVRRVLIGAAAEAGNIGHMYIDDEHLALGMARDYDSRGHLEESYKIDPEKLRDAIYEILGFEGSNEAQVRLFSFKFATDGGKSFKSLANFADVHGRVRKGSLMKIVLSKKEGVVAKALSNIGFSQATEQDVDSESQKEIEIERIKRSLGDLEKFKTMDDPEGNRLDTPLWKLEGFTEGLVRDAFGRNAEINVIGWQNYLVRGLVSKTYAELTKRGSGIGRVRGRRILEILHANGYIPEEPLLEEEINESFDDEGVVAMKNSAAAAVERNYDRIATEHLLLGVLKDRSNSACRALESLNVDPAIIQKAVLFVIDRGEEKVKAAKLIADSAKKAIRYALKEAERRGEKVNSKYIIFGLLQEGTGIAASVLESLGLSLMQWRDKALQDEQDEKVRDEINRLEYPEPL